MLKLYHGEDVIRQDPEDIDPDRWVDKGELTELPEAPLGEGERRYIQLLLKSEEHRDTSRTSTRDSNYPRRSRRDSCERRDT